MTPPTSLWLRNVIGATVACVALAVLVGVQLWPQWSAYRSTVVPERVAPAGTAITVDGQTWRVESVRRVSGETRPGASAPPTGASLVVITVARSGADRDRGCVGLLTDGRRRWSPEPFAAAPLATGATALCSLPGPLQWTFAIPADATPQALDITAQDGRIEARLQL